VTVALITGTSTGIGLETALHLARNRYRVFASLRNPDRADAIKQAIADEKLPITLVRIDVNDDASVAAGVGEVLGQAGHIDVLVNNAGIGGSVGPLELVPVEAAKATFETNYFGAIRMIRAVVPGMRARRDGSIVNITSIAGRIALGAHGHYCASKYALEAASEALALELALFNIRVAVIEPGVILTPIFQKNQQEEASQETPYTTTLERFSRFFEAQLQNPSLPDSVARTIQHAIETREPKLRYLVGKDAVALEQGRRTTSDQDWIGDHAVKNDEHYYDQMRLRFGLDLWRQPANSATQ
jgi:NAD(P)-dependent dehydrogenase (short-subunit alcohol dehydrogenase family)